MPGSPADSASERSSEDPAARAYAPPGEEPPTDAADRGTVAAKALRGILWVTSTGLASRVVSMVAALLLLRYVAPGDYGEVQSTFLVVAMVDLVTQVGIPGYLSGRSGLTKKHIAHAIFLYQWLSVLGLALCLALAKPLGPRFGAPNMHLYMPGFVVALLLQRLALVPERLLLRDLHFRPVSVARALAEVVYAGTSLGLAYAGKRLDFQILGVALTFGGGFAIVWADVVRGLFRVLAMAALVPIRRWFALVRPDKEMTKHVLRFGVPITLATLAGTGSRSWDHWAVGNLYGRTSAGLYFFAYDVSNMPPTIVGEALGDVLAPALAKVDNDERPKEVMRWVGFAGLLCFPLGVGLASVGPSLHWMFNPQWWDAVPLIATLFSLSLTRPVINVLFAYLISVGRTPLLMGLEWMKAIGVVGLVYGAGHAVRRLAPGLDTPMVACISIGVVHVANLLVYQIVAARIGGFPARRVITPLFRPLLACLPMVGAVLLVRLAIGDHPSMVLSALRLAAEILAGALAYFGAVWLLARDIALDLISVFKTRLRPGEG
jgi:lipopolysaccharide exporter